MRPQETTLHGVPISKGIGIGCPVFFASFDVPIKEVVISQAEIDMEIERYRRALDFSRKDVEQLQNHESDPPEVVSILSAHLEMMADPLLTHVVEEKIRHSKKNTESIFQHIIEEYKARFSALQDHYFQERVRDIVDVSRRILGHLRSMDHPKMSQVAPNTIILTQELVPSETVEADRAKVNAFVTASGGLTSHAAIIARAKGIPYVANIDIKQLKNIELDSLIVDGNQGLIILNPSRATLKKYQMLQKEERQGYKKLQDSSYLKGETLDGFEVSLFANVESPSEVPSLIKAGASGIGLFRSEYLIFAKKDFPSEKEQENIYKQMLKGLKGLPLVVRIFDIGGDKKIELNSTEAAARYFDAIGPEPNPALGCRAIRFLLRYPELLLPQLRAILKASRYGPIHILIPMVSDISELRAVRRYIQQLQEELKIASHIPIGCMIEVPSSAIMADVLAQEADFFSIGTNDLVQYVLASDRSHLNTAELSAHPSILRFIQSVTKAANRFHKPVTLCGECATNPSMIPLLLGLGIRNFSISVRHIPLIKQTIRTLRLLDAVRLAEQALDLFRI